MALINITIRAQSEDADVWRRKAMQDGRDLSGWIRWTLNVAAGVLASQGRAEPPVEEREGEMLEEVAEPRKGKKRGAVVSSKVERVEVSCPHGLKVGYRCSLCKPGGGIVQADGSVK